jgi:hypothetical protein
MIELYAKYYARLQKSYSKLVEKQTGGLQASNCFHMEDYLKNTIDLYVPDQIPFIEKLDRTQIQSSV